MGHFGRRAIAVQQVRVAAMGDLAGGGAARGLSGPSDWGYLSGNGLLTAVTLGHIAGLRATELTRATS